MILREQGNDFLNPREVIADASRHRRGLGTGFAKLVWGREKQDVRHGAKRALALSELRVASSGPTHRQRDT